MGRAADWCKWMTSGECGQLVRALGDFGKMSAFGPDPEKLSTQITWPKEPEVRAFLQGAAQHSNWAVLELMLATKALLHGPKILQLNTAQAHTLANTSLTLNFSDYCQPFQTMIVELPEDYTQSYEMAVTGMLTELLAPNGSRHTPAFVIVHHVTDPLCIVTGVVFSSYQVMTRLMFPPPDEIEAGLLDCESKPKVNMDQDETKLVTHMTRLALNACVMMDHLGVKSLGPANPSHYKRLQRYAQVSQGEKAAASRFEMRTMPVYYGFEQHVQVYTQRSAAGQQGEGKRKSPVTHWRRGHWRTQRFGPGRQERKRIHVPPILVRADQFAGDPANTQVTYKVKG